MLSNEKIPWKRLSAEAVAIVASILLAFAIDTWWEDRKDAELESGYLVSIREDFEANRALLERSISRYENIIRSMTALLEQSALSEPNLEVTELNQKFSLIQSMPTFFRITRTYENLTGSGDLNVIQSGELKNALADYYANAERILLVQESANAFHLCSLPVQSGFHWVDASQSANPKLVALRIEHQLGNLSGAAFNEHFRLNFNSHISL